MTESSRGGSPVAFGTGALLLVLLALPSRPLAEDVGAFEREVYGFEVLDEAGTRYDHPFLAGFNLPRPQLADIDGDGDQDLFVQEYTAAVMFFENVGTPESAEYVWRSDRFQDLDVGEWYLFVDIDGDGDLDLLAEERFSLIRYFRNEGSATEPRFKLLVNQVPDINGEPMFSDRQNIPKVGDLDGDGRLDLLIGRVEGILVHWELDRLRDDGVPVFRHLQDRFEDIEIIGQVLGGPAPGMQQQQLQIPAGIAALPDWSSIRARGSALHGANTMALEDYDGDGDLDLFWGDYFEPGLLLIENRGSRRSVSMRSAPVPFPRNAPIKTSGYNAPSFGDVDGDGDNDLLVGVLGGAFNPNNTTVENLLYLENVGRRRYQERTRRFVSQLDVGSESYPAFADTDGDGDLDLYLGNKIEPGDTQAGRLFLFENIGTSTEPRMQLRGAVEGFDEHYHYAPAFADLDADGDLDILMGTWDDELQLVRNNGDAGQPAWTVADASIAKLTRGRNATPALGDVDADGDLDLFVGESSGEMNFLRNVGSDTEPVFDLIDDKYLAIDVGRRSVPTLTDIDEDGDLDLLIGSESNGLWLYRNNGSAEEPAFEHDPSFSLPVHPFVTPVFADIDGDGDRDFFAGGIGGGLSMFRNTAR